MRNRKESLQVFWKLKTVWNPDASSSFHTRLKMIDPLNGLFEDILCYQICSGFLHPNFEPPPNTVSHLLSFHGIVHGVFWISRAWIGLGVQQFFEFCLLSSTLHAKGMQGLPQGQARVEAFPKTKLGLGLCFNMSSLVIFWQKQQRELSAEPELISQRPTTRNQLRGQTIKAQEVMSMTWRKI